MNAIAAKDLFVAALKLPQEQWKGYLAEACGTDENLRLRVHNLLHAHEQAGSFLEPAPPMPSTVHYEPLTEQTGTVIGPYKLLEKIGEGGFGVVFLAEQQEPIRRKVALKVLKPGMDSRQIVTRFEVERQTLAMMDHPNIARVFDGGATHSGRPYFVMELVKGVPITEFCDQNQLTPRQRLELFVLVCQAVQHAHQKGIIHRDLKPSNVLVSRHDTTPVVKVIDFGVAKALGQALTDKTLFTGFAQMIGTPLYMSPEQAGMSDLDVDTRSDIYSLGVLLYELLTGSTPFDKERFQQADFDEIRRIIRDEEPPKPSTRISSLGQAATIASTNRQSDPRQLSRLFRGELDWIVMKALEKDRNRRYETANDFALDTQRYLADEPVQACPPTFRYRLRKFVWRHRVAVLALAVIFLSLVGGIVGTTHGLLEAKRQEEAAVLAAEAEKKAHAATADAQGDVKAYADFLAHHVLAATRPEGIQGGIGRNVTMEEALTKVEPKLADLFHGRPKAEALARHEIGVTWRNLGKYAKAEQHLRRAVELREQQFGPEAEETLDSMNSLAVTLRSAGRTTEAIQLHESVLKSYEAQLAPDHPAALLCKNNLAVAYQDAGKFDRALSLLEELMQKRRATQGPDHPDTLRSMNNLGLAYLDAGKFDRALSLLEESLQKHQKNLGSDHPHTLTSMHNLGRAYLSAGQLSRAQTLLEETLEKHKVALGPDHPDTITSMHNLASLYQATGNHGQALTLLEETLEKSRANLPHDHPGTFSIMHSLASAYQAAGKLDRAVSLFEETVQLQKTTLGPDHPDTLYSLSGLALAYRDAGKLERALPLLEDLLVKSKAVLGLDHPRTLASMNNLGGAYRDTGKLEAALPLFEAALQKQEASLGRDHPDTLTTLNNLALAYRDAGKLDLALPLLEESLKRHTARLGPDHPHTLTSMLNLAGGYQTARLLDRSLPLFAKVLEKQREHLGPDHRDTLHTMNFLALAYLAAETPSQAVPLLEQTLEKRKATLPPDHPDTLISMYNLAHVYRDMGKLDQALPLFEMAVGGMRRKYGLGHPRTRSFVANLSDCHERMKNHAQAEPLRRELADFVKQQAGAGSPQYADQLAVLGLNLLQQKKFADAAIVLRDCLAIRETKAPDVWTTFNSRSQLGGALLGQHKYSDAEPLLLSGYEGMKQRQAKIPPAGKTRLTEALERLVLLYDSQGQKEKAAQWREKLAAQRQAEIKAAK